MFTVGSIMRKPVVRIAGTATVAEAIHRMHERGISSVLVEPQAPGGPYGIMTKRDVLSKVVAPGKDPEKLRVADLMSSPVITVPLTTSLRECSALMLEKGIRRVLVAQGNEIVGIVSDTDIFSAVEERGWGPTF
ncbi:MAG: CBS domain-containing protein [candidate division NC10 bacterium]|nr:CBS domain-containing protein [candidate division NC10 bacterium]